MSEARHNFVDCVVWGLGHLNLCAMCDRRAVVSGATLTQRSESRILSVLTDSQEEERGEPDIGDKRPGGAKPNERKAEGGTRSARMLPARLGPEGGYTSASARRPPYRNIEISRALATEK